MDLIQVAKRNNAKDETEVNFYYATAEAECFSRGPNLNAPEDYCHSALTGSFFPQVGPRLTVRHRHAGNLPTVENSADDLDNLDDVSIKIMFQIQ